jgi:pSer/pThr/pTyr-binding forkhead associated (FHA) protein
VSELTYTVIRFGLLALLWAFVLSLAAVLRRDIYGTRVSRRSPSSRQTAAVAVAAPQPPGPGAVAAQQLSRQQRRRRQPTTLVVTDGQLAGTSLPLGRQGILIGRSPECTLVLDDEYASTRHARIFPRPEGWFLEDLGSRNGTTVNGTPLSGAVPAESGTVIRIGRTTLELQG